MASEMDDQDKGLIIFCLMASETNDRVVIDDWLWLMASMMDDWVVFDDLLWLMASVVDD